MIRVLSLAAAALVLSACQNAPQPPRDAGVCYHVVPPENGEAMRLNVLATDQPQIEFCAARLEEMRQRFLGMGGSNREVMGAFQGQFIFIDRRGVSFAKSLDGVRFFALARTGDGRLAIPGAIQRDIDAEATTRPAA
jgi:hypothetical protein